MALGRPLRRLPLRDLLTDAEKRRLESAGGPEPLAV